MIKKEFLFAVLWMFVSISYAATLHVGPGFTFTTLQAALDDVQPGDTVLVHENTYAGGLFVGDLQGIPNAWIYILAAPGENVIFEGGTNAWQFSDGAYLFIQGFIFQHQTGNGVNFDDGGSYESPAHHIIFNQCTFRDISVSGNNDLLKLSGLDNFEIDNCIFLNGAAGGSGIDMVGCHDGIITGCHFENLGSNSIQAKGGTSNIRIEANFFKNAGERALNLGGSTGLQFFRPLDAPYEAANLKVYSNIIIGSTAPVAFVGCINSEVVNNTLFLPEKWALRILQETVDTSRFFPCGQNTFRNNIIYIDDRVIVECNIGPDTAPETFTFSNNLWYHSEEQGWPGPDLPANDVNNIIQQDPGFIDADTENFHLHTNSPAIGNGFEVLQPDLDYDRVLFQNPPSIGAFEGMEIINTSKILESNPFTVYPNPANEWVEIKFSGRPGNHLTIVLVTIDGRKVLNIEPKNEYDLHYSFTTKGLVPGIYYLRIKDDSGMTTSLLIIE